MTRRDKLRRSTMERIQDRSEKLVDDVRELGQLALDGTGDALRGARRRGRAGLKYGRDRLRSGVDEVEDRVAEHPLPTVLGALGVGLLLGLFLRR